MPTHKHETKNTDNNKLKMGQLRKRIHNCCVSLSLVPFWIVSILHLVHAMVYGHQASEYNNYQNTCNDENKCARHSNLNKMNLIYLQ